MARKSEDESPAIPEQQDSESRDFEPYVEWSGGAGYREVTADQWRDAGIEDQGTVVWTRESPRVLLSDLTEAAQKRLAEEPNFSFVLDEPKEND